MNYNFSEIILKKNELKTLKKLKRYSLKVENGIILNTLKCYELVEEIVIDTDDDNNLLFDGTYKISDKGERYLIYLKQLNKNVFWEWFRYILTTIIAACALIRTF